MAVCDWLNVMATLKFSTLLNFYEIIIMNYKNYGFDMQINFFNPMLTIIFQV